MSVSTRETLLEQLKDDFEKITAVRDYRSTVAEVKRGWFPTDEVINRPAIVFTNLRSEKVIGGGDTMGNTRERVLHLIIFAYVDLEPASQDYGPLDDIVADIEQFLESTDNTYYADTYVGDMAIYEGGVADPVGIAEIEARIYYDYTTSSP
jgi:hypothetical protein